MSRARAAAVLPSVAGGAGVAVHRRPRRWPGWARGGPYTFNGGKGSRPGGGKC
jgi:hypothetical protein